MFEQFTLGIEEEFQIVDPVTRELKSHVVEILEEGKLQGMIDERYAGWSTPKNKAMLAGKESLEAIAARVEKNNIDPQPKSGRQERLENLINSYC